MSEVSPESPVPPVLVPAQSGPLEVPHNPRYDLPKIDEVVPAISASESSSVSPTTVIGVPKGPSHSAGVPAIAKFISAFTRKGQKVPAPAINELHSVSVETETTTSSVMTPDSSEEADQDGQSVSPITFPALGSDGALHGITEGTSNLDAASLSGTPPLDEDMAGQNTLLDTASRQVAAWYSTDVDALLASLSSGDGDGSDFNSIPPSIPCLALSGRDNPKCNSNSQTSETGSLDNSPVCSLLKSRTEKHIEGTDTSSSLSFGQGIRTAYPFASSVRNQDMESPICLGKAVDAWKDLPPTPRLSGASSRKTSDPSFFAFVTPWASGTCPPSAIEIAGSSNQCSLGDRSREDDETCDVR